MEKPVLTIDDFLKAENLDALRKAYADRGRTFWRFSSFYNKALDDWFELHRQSIIDAPRGLPKELPATKVEKDGVTYYIHGIYHEGEIASTISKHPLWHLRGKTVIKESLIIPSSNLRTYSFSDYSAFPLEMVAFNLLHIGRFIVPFASLPRVYNIMRARQISELALSNRAYSELALVRKHSTDFMKFRAYSQATYLPMRLAIEFYEKYATAFTHNIVYGRSKYMAEFMRQFAHHKNINELHAIVGVGHEPQIAYCLENGITSQHIQKLARHYLEKELKSKGEA